MDLILEGGFVDDRPKGGKRFSTEQIVSVLKQAEMGLAVMKEVVEYVVASHGYSEPSAALLSL